ncbi:hypothetical protein EVAR_37364_1 [Eumeta japonica]|uniref:Uncharacterized protein n=1 Tax=Eumeta variegata TaxID=151549 RepID=A0A4C1X1Q2_EUMVA|nr:hypothetical protein EVAR_37364_1 [Eumeta japonica]
MNVSRLRSSTTDTMIARRVALEKLANRRRPSKSVRGRSKRFIAPEAPEPRGALSTSDPFAHFTENFPLECTTL